VSSSPARSEDRRARFGARVLGGRRDDATSADGATATRLLAAANIDIPASPARRGRVCPRQEATRESPRRVCEKAVFTIFL